MKSRVLNNTQINEAIEIADQMMATVAPEPPTWSKDAPTEPGWYWFRPADLAKFVQPVQITHNSLGIVHATLGGSYHRIEELNGLWWSERLREPRGIDGANL